LSAPAARDPETSAARGRGLALHRAVLNAFGRHAGRTRAKRNADHEETLGRSQHIKRLLRPDLERLLEQHRGAPDIAQLLVQ